MYLPYTRTDSRSYTHTDEIERRAKTEKREENQIEKKRQSFFTSCLLRSRRHSRVSGRRSSEICSRVDGVVRRPRLVAREYISSYVWVCGLSVKAGAALECIATCRT